VPFIISPALRENQWKDIRGKRAYAPVELLDLLPTLADLVQIPMKYNRGLNSWQGQSLVPILKNPKDGFVKSFAMAQYPRGFGSNKINGYTIRTMRYRLTIWCRLPDFQIGSSCFFELYDLVTNPNNDKNIAYSNPDLRQQILQSTLVAKRNGVIDDSTIIAPFDFEERKILPSVPGPSYP
jgi:arylsulfatase A-like enzyme